MAATVEAVRQGTTRIRSTRKLALTAALRDWARRGSVSNTREAEMGRSAGGRC